MTRYRPPGPLGLGGAPLGNLFAPVAEPAAEATIEAAWQAGLRYFDTAPLYGLGLSEERMGRVLRGKPRDGFALSSKVGRLLEPTADKPHEQHGYALSGCASASATTIRPRRHCARSRPASPGSACPGWTWC